MRRRWLERPRELHGASLFAAFGRIEHRVLQPLVDAGFAPACAANADLNILGESAILHLPVHGRAAEAGAFEDGF